MMNRDEWKLGEKDDTQFRNRALRESEFYYSPYSPNVFHGDETLRQNKTQGHNPQSNSDAYLKKITQENEILNRNELQQPKETNAVSNANIIAGVDKFVSWILPENEFRSVCGKSAFMPDSDGYPLLPNGNNEWRFSNCNNTTNAKYHNSNWPYFKKSIYDTQNVSICVRDCDGAYECSACSRQVMPQTESPDYCACKICRNVMKRIRCDAKLIFYLHKISKRLIVRHCGTHSHRNGNKSSVSYPSNHSEEVIDVEESETRVRHVTPPTNVPEQVIDLAQESSTDDDSIQEVSIVSNTSVLTEFNPNAYWTLPKNKFRSVCTDSNLKPDRNGYPLRPDGNNSWRFLNYNNLKNIKYHKSEWALKKSYVHTTNKGVVVYTKDCLGVVECEDCSVYKRPKKTEGSVRVCKLCSRNMKWTRCNAQLCFYEYAALNRLIVRHIDTHGHHLPPARGKENKHHDKDFEQCSSSSEDENTESISRTNQVFIPVAKISNERNCLRELINKIIRKIQGIEIDFEIYEVTYKKILKMFQLEYDMNMQELQVCNNHHVNYKIDLLYLINTLNEWNGWVVYKLSEDEAQERLFCYLNEKFLDYKLNRDSCILENLKSMTEELEDYISVTCSLKQLKMLFYHSPHNNATCYQNDLHQISSICKPIPFSLDYIFNCSYIATRIKLPNFTMTHKNVHSDEYYLSNITDSIETIERASSTQLFYKPNDKPKEIFITKFIIKFLRQFKKYVHKRKCTKKNELVMVLTEFENDLALCYDTIETNTEYYADMTRHPYVRYLGYSDDEDNKISIKEQKSTDNSIFNIRLQQIRSPKIAFNLESFNARYEDNPNGILFLFNRSSSPNLDTCITYECTLCEENFDSSDHIPMHMSKYHGVEPDWECTKCKKSFTNEDLLKQRWSHQCGSDVHTIMIIDD